MAQVQRNDIDPVGDPLAQPVGDAGRYPAGDARRYDAGGHIAELQADLARRLGSDGAAADPAAVAITSAERLVRFCSVAGGYAALLAGYAAVGLAIAYWV